MQEHDELRPEISGVHQAVVPRAKWTSEVTNVIKAMKADIEVFLKKQSEETKEQIDILNSKIELLNQQARKKLGYIQRVGGILKQDVKDYIISQS